MKPLSSDCRETVIGSARNARRRDTPEQHGMRKPHRSHWWTTLHQLGRRWAPASWEHRFYTRREQDPGLDFSGVVLPEDVGLDPRHAVRSTPSSDQALRRLLDSLVIAPTHCILDVGSGKGSAMRVMLDYPFARVDGLELAEDLVQIARQNFARLGVEPSRCQVHAGDAATFDALDDYSHLYLYNPFSADVLRAHLQQVSASLRRQPRPLWLLYVNAKWTREIDALGLFRLERRLPGQWAQPMRIYRAN